MSISLAISDMATRLSTVAPVRIGRAALETTSADLPVITVYSTKDEPSPGTERMRGGVGVFIRSVTVEAKVAAGAAYHTTLDTMLCNMRAAIRQSTSARDPLSGQAIELVYHGARFFAPEQSENCAVVQLDVSFTYTQSY